jgi:diguanylate cyclase (GGDEF)-like protein
LSKRVREHDAVVRVGGDEFLILLPDANATNLSALVARLEADKGSAPCRYSLGSTLRMGAEALAESMVRADTQMYELRRAARGEKLSP